MTHKEGFDLATGKGTDILIEVVQLLENKLDQSYALIGGLALNSYLDPVMTLDADFAVAVGCVRELEDAFVDAGWKVQLFPHSLNVEKPSSRLSVQFSIDDFYKDFPSRAERRKVFEVEMQVACIEDILKGKVLAVTDEKRRPSKVLKDAADIQRICEAYSGLEETVPWDQVEAATSRAFQGRSKRGASKDS